MKRADIDHDAKPPVRTAGPDPSSDWLATPAVILAANTVALTGYASFGPSLAPILPVALVVDLGICSWWLARRSTPKLTIIACAGMAWLCLAWNAQGFWPAASVSTGGDAWSYGAMASYFAHFGRNVTEGMPLIDQYGSHLAHSRYASACLLALFVQGTGGDLFQAHLVFYFACLVVLATSTAHLAGTFGLTHWQRLSTAFLTTVFGWIPNALEIGSYDNVLFLAIAPAAISQLIRFQRNQCGFGHFVLSGSILGAALLCAYPEGVALVGVLSIPILVVIGRSALTETRVRGGIILVAVGSCVIAAPYLPDFVTFLRNQLASTGLGAVRPGIGIFAGLLGPGAWPAMFALGNESPGARFVPAHLVLPCAATMLVAVGIWRTRRSCAWFPWLTLPLAATLIWQAAVTRYDYGTYKVLLCSSWWLVPALVSGGAALREWRRSWIVPAILAGLVAAAAVQRWSLRAYRPCPPKQNLHAYEELASLRFVVRGKPILVNLDNGFDQLWATAFLRDVPLRLVTPVSYYGPPHVRAVTSRAEPAPLDSDHVWVLRAGPAHNSTWFNGLFSLTSEPGAFIAAVQNPNGLETVEGKPYVWISSSLPTIFTISAQSAGFYELRSERWGIGASVPGLPEMELEISDHDGPRQERFTNDTQFIRLHLDAGENQISLRSLAQRTVMVMPHGDPRELMLGILGYYVLPDSRLHP